MNDKDIISFEYFEEMTTNWNRIDLLRRCYDLCNEMVEKKQEIERLNNIINEIKKENKQLKTNWDKLKEWLESNWEESQDIWFVKIINKMQELEQGSDKE